MKPYQLSNEEVVKKFGSNVQIGLTKKEANHRKLKYGENKLRELERDSWIKVFIRQFNSPLIYILLIAAAIIFFVGQDRHDAFIITGVLIFNAILGSVQEGKARSIIESLRHFIKAECIVIRDGQKQFIDEQELVPGDLIMLLEGEKVPADARIIESTNLKIDESILTGESNPVKKISEKLRCEPDFGSKLDEQILYCELPIYAQSNMAFKGTYIVAGSAKAIVTDTGMQSQIGKISECAKSTQESSGQEMPLRKEIDRLAKFIIYFIFLVCVLIFLVGIISGKPIRELFVTLTALFICVIPEGLPVVLTLILVIGARKLADKNVLVKKMQAVEGLGKVDTILVDKTGTLTRNELMVSKVFIGDKEYDFGGSGYFETGEIIFNKNNKKSFNKTEPENKEFVYKEFEGEKLDDKEFINNNLVLMAKAGYLLNRAEINYIKETNSFEIKGDPTEAAMYVMSKKIDRVINFSANKNNNKIDNKNDDKGENKNNFCKKIGEICEKNCEILYEIPFSSKWRYHAIYCKIEDKVMVFISGAPETIMERSKNIDFKEKENLESLLKEGFRVVAVAVKEFDKEVVQELERANGNLKGLAREKFFEDFVSSGLEFLGFCAINDSIRTEVKDLVKNIKKAGIDIVMLTGDHIDTAIFVATKVGIYDKENGDLAIDGKTLENLSQEQLEENLQGKLQGYFGVSKQVRLESELVGNLESELPVESKKITVFARVTPEQKLKIVNAYKKIGKTVAMTGDGINDAPSLIAANIGIAMGGIGTEVAKQASDIILLDDSFASIASGIEYGRHIFYTLRRVILYFFSTNMGEILVVLFSVILGLPIPITAAQILWLNLITDGFLDTALSAEKVEKDITKVNGFKHGARIIDKKLFYKVFYMALPMGIFSILIFNYYKSDIVLARTMTMLTMAMFQWFNAFNCRSEKRSIFELGFFSNKWLLLAISGVLGLQFFVIYNPVMQKIFNTKPVTFYQWLLVFVVSSSVFIIEEIRKFIAKRV